jgi:hypothetical protein
MDEKAAKLGSEGSGIVKSIVEATDADDAMDYIELAMYCKPWKMTAYLCIALLVCLCLGFSPCSRRFCFCLEPFECSPGLGCRLFVLGMTVGGVAIAIGLYRCCCGHGWGVVGMVWKGYIEVSVTGRVRCRVRWITFVHLTS